MWVHELKFCNHTFVTIVLIHMKVRCVGVKGMSTRKEQHHRDRHAWPGVPEKRSGAIQMNPRSADNQKRGAMIATWVVRLFVALLAIGLPIAVILPGPLI